MSTSNAWKLAIEPAYHQGSIPKSQAPLGESQELGLLSAGPGDLLAAEEAERRRIAREVHDELGQRLALLVIRIDEIGQRPTEDLRTCLYALKQQVVKIAEDADRICDRLHPAVLEALGLTSALRALCSEITRWNGVSVRFLKREVPKNIPSGVALCLYRITQEALHNVVKHSRARRARVTLRSLDSGCLGSSMELVIRDYGCGFALNGERETVSRPGRGLGLASIQERARLAGGEFSIQSAPGKGTRVRVVVPCAMPCVVPHEATVAVAQAASGSSGSGQVAFEKRAGKE